MEKQSSDKGQLQLLESSTPAFALQTCVQINKDLQGVSLMTVSLTDIKETTILEDLIQQLMPILNELVAESKLSQFIYLVDLNETDFKKSLQRENFSDLAYLVIKREAQKVYLKNKFSQSSSIE
ncbi:MAG: hypothetical protein GQ574_28790 [Crocinitomix sp.]|nr:hypothetical protein [Crocinitomix sp.]